MGKSIFVSLNTSRDMYLTAQVKNYLDKKNINYKMDYYNFDNESVADGNDIDRFVQIVKNYYNKENLFKDVKLSEKKKKHIENQIIFFKNLKEYDIYCFSLYDAYLSIQPIIALLLKEKYPNSKITFGGPEIVLRDFTYESLKLMGFYCTRGDFEESLYQLIVNEKEFYNSNHFYNLSKLTKDDVPKYSSEELKYLNYKIMVSSSRGCANNCYFCSSPALSRYNLLKRDVLVEWFDYYNKIGVKKVQFNDSTLNKFEFDKLLDGLIKINNKIDILKTDLAFDGLTIEQIRKMKKAGFREVAFGIECLNPILSKNINKKMPSLDTIYSLLKELNKEKIYVTLFYIAGVPTQTKEIFYEELEFLKKIDKDFDNVLFEFYDYFVSPKSYIEENYEKYNVTQLKENIANSNSNQLKYLFSFLKRYKRKDEDRLETKNRMIILYKNINNVVQMSNSNLFKQKKITKENDNFSKNLTIAFSGFNIKNAIKIAIRSFLNFHPNYKNNICFFDDNSTDGTSDFLKKEGIKVISWKNKEYINNKEKETNITFRVNLITKEIMEQTKTKYLAIFDGDIIFLKEFMSQISEIHEEYDVIGFEDVLKGYKVGMSEEILKKFNKYSICSRGKDNYSRIWFGFVFLNLDKLKEKNYIFDDIDDKDYNIYLNSNFDSGVDFYSKILKDSSIKICYINGVKILEEYIYHLGGKSVNIRAFLYNLEDFKYKLNQVIPDNVKEIIKKYDY